MRTTATPLAVVRRLAREVSRSETREPLTAIRRLIDRLPLAALVADDEGHYVLTNAAGARLTGYSASELRRRSVWDLTPSANQRDFEVLWRAFLRQKEQRGVYEVLTKSGRVRKAAYAARAHLLPHLHVTVLRPADSRRRKRTARVNRT
jgi:PAS domain S-box-containing protein